MSSSSLQPSRHLPILLVDPDKDLARKAQALLFGYFSDSLDLALADSLDGGIAHLHSYKVRLIIMGPAFPGQTISGAVRALRLAAPASGIVVYRFASDESFRLDALRAGAHEVSFITGLSPEPFRSAIEWALARSWQTTMDAAIQATPKLVHDLNNAITAINGFADILLNRAHGDAQSRACVEQIRNAGTRAADLINSLAPPTMRQEPDSYTSRAA